MLVGDRGMEIGDMGVQDGDGINQSRKRGKRRTKYISLLQVGVLHLDVT